MSMLKNLKFDLFHSSNIEMQEKDRYPNGYQDY